MARLRRLILERLIRYYRYLSDLTAKKPIRTITSAQMGAALDVDPTQVRKDFAAIGVLGMGRVGFDVCEVCRAIRAELGFDQPYEAVLIGAGRLGSALLAYSGFAPYGLRIVGAFDNDRRKIGAKIGGRFVRPMGRLRSFIKRRNIRLAILTTPVEVSQKLADRLASAGVLVVWNFTPIRLTPPPGVLVRNEHIAAGLSQISYHLKQLSQTAQPPTHLDGGASRRRVPADYSGSAGSGAGGGRR